MRTIGLLDTPTDDGRLIESPATLRQQPLPLMARRRDGTVDVFPAEFEITGREVRAAVPWRFWRRYINLDTHAKVTYAPARASHDLPIEMRLSGVTVLGATVGGPTAFAELRRWWRR